MIPDRNRSEKRQRRFYRARLVILLGLLALLNLGESKVDCCKQDEDGTIVQNSKILKYCTSASPGAVTLAAGQSLPVHLLAAGGEGCDPVDKALPWTVLKNDSPNVSVGFGACSGSGDCLATLTAANSLKLNPDPWGVVGHDVIYFQLSSVGEFTGGGGASVDVSLDRPTQPADLPISFPGDSKLSVSRRPIAFGAVKVGQAASETIRITNIGSAPAVINSASIGNERDQFTSSGLPRQIGPGRFATLVITFTPKRVGAFTTTLDLSYTVPPTGSGVAPLGHGDDVVVTGTGQ